MTHITTIHNISFALITELRIMLVSPVAFAGFSLGVVSLLT
jgi:hypothetical protein